MGDAGGERDPSPPDLPRLAEELAAGVLELVRENARLRGRVRELERSRDTIALRCGYILGMCRGEDEMRAEARAILRVLEGTDG